jgi:hypothetical protein
MRRVVVILSQRQRVAPHDGAAIIGRPLYIAELAFASTKTFSPRWVAKKVLLQSIAIACGLDYHGFSAEASQAFTSE